MTEKEKNKNHLSNSTKMPNLESRNKGTFLLKKDLKDMQRKESAGQDESQENSAYFGNLSKYQIEENKVVEAPK